MARQEGDVCGYEGCDGIMGYEPVENCSCHISPPCSACVENPLVCLKCGDDQVDIPYIDAVKDLASKKYDILKLNADIVHGIIGCVTEAGEMMDALKKTIFYGKEFDVVNLKEEMGDIMWYLALLCGVLGTTFEEIQELNIKKLHSRYKYKKFTVPECADRDLKKEREILEDE